MSNFEQEFTLHSPEPKTLWAPRRGLDPLVISNVLATEFFPVEDPRFRDGYEWRIGGMLNARLTVFPRAGLASTSFLNSANEEQVRRLPVNRIIETPNRQASVSVLSRSGSRFSTFTVSSDGQIVEQNIPILANTPDAELINSISEGLFTINVADNKATDRPLETAESDAEIPADIAQIVGSFKVDDIENILGALNRTNLRNFEPTPLVWAFLKQFRRSESEVVARLVGRSIAALSSLPLDSAQQERYQYLTHRYVHGKTVTEIAKIMGYSREHTNRKYHQSSLGLLLTGVNTISPVLEKSLAQFRNTSLERSQLRVHSFDTETTDKTENLELQQEVDRLKGELRRIKAVEDEKRTAMENSPPLIQVADLIAERLRKMPAQDPAKPFLRALRNIVKIFNVKSSDENPEVLP